MGPGVASAEAVEVGSPLASAVVWIYMKQQKTYTGNRGEMCCVLFLHPFVSPALQHLFSCP